MVSVVFSRVDTLRSALADEIAGLHVITCLVVALPGDEPHARKAKCEVFEVVEAYTTEMAAAWDTGGRGALAGDALASITTLYSIAPLLAQARRPFVM